MGCATSIEETPRAPLRPGRTQSTHTRESLRRPAPNPLVAVAPLPQFVLEPRPPRDTGFPDAALRSSSRDSRSSRSTTCSYATVPACVPVLPPDWRSRDSLTRFADKLHERQRAVDDETHRHAALGLTRCVS